MLSDLLHHHTQALQGVVDAHNADIEALAQRMAGMFSAGHKVLLAGNGGSACDAMHIAGEFVGRFIHDRPSLAAIALSADSGILTAVGNDYGYDEVFARQVEGLGRAGDVFIALSTSGKSPNILKAIAAAKARNIYTVLLTGEKARSLPVIAELTVIVPSTVTAHIQEAHLFLLHALTGMIEKQMGLTKN